MSTASWPSAGIWLKVFLEFLYYLLRGEHTGSAKLVFKETVHLKIKHMLTHLPVVVFIHLDAEFRTYRPQRCSPFQKCNGTR